MLVLTAIPMVIGTTIFVGVVVLMVVVNAGIVRRNMSGIPIVHADVNLQRISLAKVKVGRSVLLTNFTMN